MKKRLLAKILIFSFLFNLTLPAFSANTSTTPKPYDNEELPQTFKDIRRFEIITLGALPFVTLDTTLVFSTVRYVDNDFDDAYKPDIFAKSNFTEDEQKRIIATSLGICVGIGLTDLIVQIIKRSSKKRRERLISYEDITILPISEDPDAQEIPLPETGSDSSEATEVIEIIDAIEEIEE